MLTETHRDDKCEKKNPVIILWKTTAITFEARIIRGKHPSELTFAYDVLNKIRLSSLAYGIVSVHKRDLCHK